MSGAMTSMERIGTALSHAEPDRVPVMLTVTMHGAKELGLSIEEYFSKPRHVVEGQLRLRRKFGHDCLNALTYGAMEYEAFGGRATFADDGPPNAGEPVIRTRADIFNLTVPKIQDVPKLQDGLAITRGLTEAAAGEVPVVGVAISPFSMPVMLMGFQGWLDLLHDDREAVDRLMEVTGRFCSDWANAQFAAGATAVAYYDPVSASDITHEDLFREIGLPAARRTIQSFQGAAAYHLASGRALGRIDDYASTGAAGLGVSSQEDLGKIKRQCAGRLAVIGNLNGIKMVRWSPEEMRAAAAACIAAAAPGGGFVLSDNHGEIPFQVPDETLHALMDTARELGTYPIRGTDDV
ncbi:MAG: uroporphyrinogen decarboxylase family protein [Pseudomonadota bacterium]